MTIHLSLKKMLPLMAVGALWGWSWLSKMYDEWDQSLT